MVECSSTKPKNQESDQSWGDQRPVGEILQFTTAVHEKELYLHMSITCLAFELQKFRGLLIRMSTITALLSSELDDWALSNLSSRFERPRQLLRFLVKLLHLGFYSREFLTRDV